MSENATGGPPPEPWDDGPVLLHSLAEFREIILHAIEAVAPRRIVEVGGEGAAFTRALADWCGQHDVELLCVEPAPSPALRTLADEGRVTIIEGKSPEALAEVGRCDVYVLDGDHNHWVVTGELRAIYADRPDDAPLPLTIMHDVAWPAARRDQYYAPADVPAEHRQPYSYEGRATPGQAELGDSGFFGDGEFAYALVEGGPANGVLTAVDDVLAEVGGLGFMRIPCIFGVGFVVPEAAPWAAEVTARVAPYDELPLLRRLERNRLRLYGTVLDLQRELERVRRVNDRVVAGLHEQLGRANAAAAAARVGESGA